MRYTIFWVGGKNDGNVITETDNVNTAIQTAREFYREHETEFDPCWGGVAIVDEKTGTTIAW